MFLHYANDNLLNQLATAFAPSATALPTADAASKMVSETHSVADLPVSASTPALIPAIATPVATATTTGAATAPVAAVMAAPTTAPPA